MALDGEPAIPATVDIQDVLNPLILRFRESLTSNVKFVASICEKVHVRVDPLQLRQALSELLGNGRDFSENGVLLLTVSEEELPDSILISPTVEASGWLRLRVEDSGLGFSDLDPQDLFAPCFSTRKKALGIGLTIVENTVRENGIGLDASGKCGGVFDLYLPIVSELNTDTERSLRDSKAYVWIVEDEEALLEFMKESLEMEGYTVRAFSRPTDLLEVLQPGADDQPDLLLLDVALPEMSGPELFAEIQLRGCNPKVLWSSGYGPNSPFIDKDTTSAFLQKPYTPSDLVEAVRKAT